MNKKLQVLHDFAVQKSIHVIRVCYVRTSLVGRIRSTRPAISVPDSRTTDGRTDVAMMSDGDVDTLFGLLSFPLKSPLVRRLLLSLR